MKCEDTRGEGRGGEENDRKLNNRETERWEGMKEWDGKVPRQDRQKK